MPEDFFAVIYFVY